MTTDRKLCLGLILAILVAFGAMLVHGGIVPVKPTIYKHAEVTQGMGAADLLAKPVPVPGLRVQEVEFRLARTDYTNVWWALESSLDGRAWQTERETVTELVMTVTNLGEQKKFYRLKGRFHP